MQKTNNINLTQIYQSRDSLSLSDLIDNKHIFVRNKLIEQLNNYITLREKGNQSIVDSISSELNWLVSQYTLLTDCPDISTKLTIYQNWSDSQITKRLTLDTSLQNIYTSYLRKEIDLNKILINFSKLKLQYEVLGDLFQSAYISYKQARICYDNNQLSLCLPYLKHALSTCHIINDYSTEVKVQLLITKYYNNFEWDYHKAEKALDRGIECLKIIGDYPLLAFYTKFRAYNFLLSGQTNDALVEFNQALNEFSKENVKLEMAECNYFIGETYYYMKKYDSAVYFGNKALKLRQNLVSEKPNIISKVGISLSNLGLYMAALGDTNKALEKFNNAEKVLQKTNDKKEICINRINKALILIRLHKINEARDLLNSAIRSKERFTDITMTLFELAICDYYENKLDDALSKLRLCITRLESSRDKITVAEYKVAMLSDKIEFYNLAANIFIKQYAINKNKAKLDSAFFYLERSKAKTLNDMLLTSNIKETSLDNLADSLINLISNYENKLLNNQTDLSLRTEIQQLERLLHTTKIEKTKVASDFQLDLNNNIPNLSETQKILKKNEILLEYMISEFGSYLFTIDKKSIDIINLNSNSLQINNLTEEYCNSINKRPQSNTSSKSFKKIGQKLYDILIPKTLEKRLKEKHITIIASSKLYYLPFEALIDNTGKFMVENNNFSYIPSIKIRELLAKRLKKTSNKIYAFGNPSYDNSSLDPLPFSENEVNSIVKIFGKQNTIVFKGINATESNFKKIDYSNTNIIHIATHGITYVRDPRKSALIFAGDINSEGHSMLHSEEIAKLHIPADLVFLSACKSGIGKSFPGEGVLSLCQPFLIAGSNSVIASYWNVNDCCSVELVKNFYKSLKLGYSKSQSLARAKKNLINNKRTAWNHPYYWAPFVLTGLDN